MSVLTSYGTITGGKLTLSNRKRFEEDMRAFKDGTVELTIRRKNRRSSPQNRYLWGVVYKEIEIRLRQLGNDVNADVVHEFLKDRFNKKELIGEGGEVIDYIPGSTAKMNKDEFSEYIEKIIAWAASFLQITIPLPNENLQFKF